MIVVDLLGVQNRDHGERGVARYVLNLAMALEALNPTLVDVYLVHSHLPIPAVLDPLIASGKVVEASEFARSVPLEGGSFLAGSLFELDETDETVIPLWARAQEWELVAILYDLIPLLFPEDYLASPADRYRLTSRYSLFRMCDQVLAISEATAQDGIHHLGLDPSKVTTIGAGADHSFTLPTHSQFNAAANLIRAEIGVEPGFVLAPTGIDPRKNNQRLLEAYAGLPLSVRQGSPLVLSTRLSPTDRTNLERQAAKLSISEHLVLPGFVKDDVLVALYQTAGLVVFASLYEGFGLPALEAKQCGAPVIASDTSSLVEVLPDASARFDPYSVNDLRSIVYRSLTDPQELERLRHLPTGTFSWSQTAAITGDMLTTTHRRAVLRVALVAPTLDLNNSAGTEAARLRHLLEGATVTMYAGDASTGACSISELGFNERIDGAYHQVIFILDDSSGTSLVIEAMRSRSGVADLCSVSLTTAYNAESGPTGEVLEDWYPGRYRPSVVAQSTISEPERFGIRLLREVADLSEEVWVHRETDANIFKLDTGSDAIVVTGDSQLADLLS